MRTLVFPPPPIALSLLYTLYPFSPFMPSFLFLLVTFSLSLLMSLLPLLLPSRCLSPFLSLFLFLLFSFNFSVSFSFFSHVLLSFFHSLSNLPPFLCHSHLFSPSSLFLSLFYQHLLLSYSLFTNPLPHFIFLIHSHTHSHFHFLLFIPFSFLSLFLLSLSLILFFPLSFPLIITFIPSSLFLFHAFFFITIIFF